MTNFLQSYKVNLLTRLAQGIAAGAIATMVIGFYWGGWVTGGTTREMVQKSSTSAVVAALAPICVDNFQRETAPLRIWSN